MSASEIAYFNFKIKSTAKVDLKVFITKQLMEYSLKRELFLIYFGRNRVYFFFFAHSPYFYASLHG